MALSDNYPNMIVKFGTTAGFYRDGTYVTEVDSPDCCIDVMAAAHVGAPGLITVYDLDPGSSIAISGILPTTFAEIPSGELTQIRP